MLFACPGKVPCKMSIIRVRFLKYLVEMDMARYSFKDMFWNHSLLFTWVAHWFRALKNSGSMLVDAWCLYGRSILMCLSVSISRYKRLGQTSAKICPEPAGSEGTWKLMCLTFVSGCACLRHIKTAVLPNLPGRPQKGCPAFVPPLSGFKICQYGGTFANYLSWLVKFVSDSVSQVHICEVADAKIWDKLADEVKKKDEKACGEQNSDATATPYMYRKDIECLEGCLSSQMQPIAPKVFMQCQEAKKKEDRAIEKLNRQQDWNWRNVPFEVARDARDARGRGSVVHFKILKSFFTLHTPKVIFHSPWNVLQVA